MRRFECDAALMERALTRIRGRHTHWKQRRRLNELIGELQSETRLANGPLPDRSAYWKERALATQHRVREELGEC